MGRARHVGVTDALQMPFTHDDLVKECSRCSKRSRLKGDLGKYCSIWTALSAWIRSRLERRLGASIPGFGQWGWYDLQSREQGTVEPTEPNLRLGFTASDRFTKRFNLVAKTRDFSACRHTKSKEVNVYEVAIRFSHKLKKDDVFCGLKDLLQRIGETAHSCKPIKIEFPHIGSLVIKERKVTFEFDPDLSSMPAGDEQCASPCTGPRMNAIPTHQVDGDEYSSAPSWLPDESVPHLLGGPFKPRESDYDEANEYIARIKQEFGAAKENFDAQQQNSSRPQTSASFMSQLDNGFLSPGGQGRVQRWMKQERNFDGRNSARLNPSARSIHHPKTLTAKRGDPDAYPKSTVRSRPTTAGSMRSGRNVPIVSKKSKKPAFALGRLVMD